MTVDAGVGRPGFVSVAFGKRMARVLRPGSLIAATAALLAPGLWLGPSMDAAVFALAGLRIRDGYVPYTDLWDHKPPGSYLLNALGQTVLPWLDPWLVSWLLTFVFTTAAILIVEGLLRRLVSPIAAFLMSLVCLILIASYPVALGGGLTESFAILPLLLALWVVSTLPPGWRASACVGSLAGLACLASFQALPAAAVLGVATVLADVKPSSAVRRAIAAVAGGAVVPLAVVGWLAARGALGDAIDQVVVYNAAYREASAGFGYVLPATILLLAGLAVPVAITIGRMVQSPRSFDRVCWLCLAWSLAQTASFASENRLFLHYLVVLVPPIALLSGTGFEWLIAAIRSPRRRSKSLAIGLAVVAACLFAISAVSTGGLSGITMAATAEAETNTVDTAAWIKANTPATATVFVWGDDTYFYLVARRSPYDRYVYQFPMVTGGYWSPEKTAALLSSWKSSPPPVIVETPSTVPMFRARSESDEPRHYDTLEPLRDFIRSRYRLAVTFGKEDVYLFSP